MLHQYQASPALNLSGFQEQMERRNNWKQPSPPGITDSHTILCLWASDQGIKRVEENWQWHLALVYFHALFAPVVAQDRGSLFAEISTLRTIGRERDNLQDQTCHPESAEPFACSLCLLIWQVNSKWKLPVYLISYSYFLLAHFVWVFLAGNNSDGRKKPSSWLFAWNFGLIIYTLLLVCICLRFPGWRQYKRERDNLQSDMSPLG